MNTYGFIVEPSEIRPRFSFDEGMDGTVFVEVDDVSSMRKDGKMVAHFYYKRNFAKWNAVTEEELRARFPKSFAKKDAGTEYEKLPKS